MWALYVYEEYATHDKHWDHDPLSTQLPVLQNLFFAKQQSQYGIVNRTYLVIHHQLKYNVFYNQMT